MKQCFKVTVVPISENWRDRYTFTVVASNATIAISKAIAAARREYTHRTWDAVELSWVGEVS